MHKRKIKISSDIFVRYPEFKRGVIIVRDIKVAEKNKRIKKPLNNIIKQRQSENIDYNEHPFVKAWDEAHLKFNSNPEQYPPSIKALLSRVAYGGGLPFINSVVTLFNYISIKYLVPCGGDDIDSISGNLYLGFATGNELFTGLGSTETEHPVKGEVIYYDDKSNQVMCRRWNWRNAEFSKITTGSQRIVINIDGIDAIPESTIIQARDELDNLLKLHCNADTVTELLLREKQEICLSD